MQNSSSMRAAFIGVGKMGAGMAGRLIDAGFSLAVYDTRREAAQPLVDRGANWACSPREAAEQAPFICTSLPGPAEAESAYLGADGIVHGARRGSVCIDFSTSAPEQVRRIAAQLAAVGAAMIDAPVSGGVEGARSGKLTVLIGGETAAIAACRPLLDAVAATILPVGPVGAASVCKVLHNCAVFCANLAMVECLTAGVKAGVPAATLVEVFQKSGLGRNLDLQVAMPATLFRGNFEPRFAMATALKDMRLATDLAESCAAPLELAAICERDMTAAVERGWGDRDNTVFLKLREERVGSEVRIE
jgi:3-hydroxyisobutyrate dehydrogenase